ncbi:Putative modulator of DNA gyrase [Lutispora thermophila DSM 19022]|uniref:Putative modulator of DNA gyrase n=2 Tax=Lutispora TaxID=667112 RepID=A0A1M6I7E1_9FIRM|nr:Putative modulator of DNA gyrase [Lutispora thermophila DSM 19022]
MCNMGFVQCRNIKHFIIDDGCLKLISTPVNIIGKDDEYHISGGTLKPLSTFELKRLEADINKETEKEIKNLRVLSNYSDKDFNFTVSLHYDYCEIEGKELKKVYSLVEVFYNGVSIDYLIFNSNTIQYIKELKEHLQEKYLCFNDTVDYKGELPLLFTDQAAVVLAHEFLGHMLEIDNFYFFKYNELINDVESLKLTVWDDPLIPNSSAYYKYDDAGIAAKVTNIIDKGNFTGNLIGGKINEMVVKSSLRRDYYSNKLLPRMSNFMVQANCSAKKPKRYIEISKLSRCFINHNNKVLELNVGLALLMDNSTRLKRVNPFYLKLTIKELLEKIHPIQSHNFLRPLKCYKRGQVIQCGGTSCDWLLLN